MKIAVMRVESQFPDTEPPLPLPSRAYLGDAGMDLYAAEDSAIIYHGERWLMRTGIALAIPMGMVGLVMPRSGLAHDHGLTVLNAPGVVDAGYRGEIKVNIINLGFSHHLIKRGDRIAQIVFQSVERPDLIEVEKLDDTRRGTNGYGSSGTGIHEPGQIEVEFVAETKEVVDTIRGQVKRAAVECNCPRPTSHTPGGSNCWGPST